MATNWLSKLLGGSTSPYGTTPITSNAQIARYTPYQEKTINTYADRMTAMARYYNGANAGGVAGVRAIDNLYNRTPAYKLPSQRSPVGPAGTVANVRLYDKYQDYMQRLRIAQTYGQRWEKGAEDFYLRNPNYVTPPVGLNNNAPGYGDTYAGGYGGGGYGGGGTGAATMPDWYQSFLSQVNWRI